MTSPQPTAAPLRAADVDAAREQLARTVRRTPVAISERLSELAGVPVWLKREDLQPVRSYKLRGAYLFLDSLDEASREAGVVAASAGVGRWPVGCAPLVGRTLRVSRCRRRLRRSAAARCRPDRTAHSGTARSRR